MNQRSQSHFDCRAVLPAQRDPAARACPGLGRASGLWTLVFLAGGLMGLLAVAEPLGAQEVITGDSLVPTNRAVVNFLALAAWEQRYPASVTNRPPLILAPLLARLGEPEDVDLPPDNGAAGGPALPAGEVRVAAVSPAPAANFLGLGDDMSVSTPDTQGAVGPNHIMVVLNSQVRIMNRQGAALSTVSLSTFWLAISRQTSFTMATRPRLLFDPYNQRWILSCLGNEGGSSTQILLAVSATSDPTGNWYVFSVYVDPQNYYYYNLYYIYGDYATADYISMGFNKQWIVVTANMLPLYYSGLFFYSTYSGVNVFVFDKLNLYTNGTGNFTILQAPADYRGSVPFSMVPSVNYDESAPEIYLAEVDNMMGSYSLTRAGTRLRLSKLTGEVMHPLLQIGSAYPATGANWGNQDTSFAGLGAQQGSQQNIQLNDARIQNLVYRNGTLWCAHTIFVPTLSPRYGAVQWWQLTTNGVVLQSGRIEDTTGVRSYAFPSLAVNHCNDVLVGYSGFATNLFPSAYYSFRLGSDPLNSFRDPRLYKAGLGPYEQIAFGTNLPSANTWGNYSATVVDPANDLDLWTLQEYADTPIFSIFGNMGRWGTWWASVDAASITTCGQVQFAARRFEVMENDPAQMAVITVTNFTGLAGSVSFATSDGTAVEGVDYNGRRGTLTFAPGQKYATFNVLIQDDGIVNSNRTVNLALFSPSNFSLGSLTNAVLTIVDDEYVAAGNIAGEFNFSTYIPTNYYWSTNQFFYSPYFVASELESTTLDCDFSGWRYSPDPYWEDRNARGALITITRMGQARGRVMVDFMTAIGGSAVADYDYRPVTNTLVFDDYQMSTNVLVPTIGLYGGYFFGNANGPRTVRLALVNPRPAPEEELRNPGALRPTLGPGSESTLIIMPVFYRYIDSITYTNGMYVPSFTNFAGFSFEHVNYRVDEYYDPTDTNTERQINIHVFKLGKGGTVRLHVAWGYGWWGNNWYGGTWYGKLAGSDDAVSGRRIYPNPVFTDPALGTIISQSDFDAFTVDLSFADNECLKNVPILIHQDPDVEFNEDIYCWLEQLRDNPPVNPYMAWTTVTILYNNAPAGALDREWNPDGIAETTPPWNTAPGANNVVMALGLQPDGKTVLAGDFTAVNAEPRVRVARLNPDGSLDTGFDPQLGADRSVNAMVVYPPTSLLAGRMLVAGSFTSFNGTQRNGIARLLPNGFLDGSFMPGNGVNGAIHGLALQADEKIIVVGDFSLFNDVPRNGIARLNPNGSLDTTYDPTPGANGIVWAVALTPAPAGAEKAVIAGDFTTVNGRPAVRVAQLNPDGTSDTTFDAGTVDGPVFSAVAQRDGRILVGGDFRTINNIPRVRLARLLPNGALDLSFNPQYGADDSIYTITLQEDGKPLIGGIFTSYNNTRRMGLARLRVDGTLDTSFLDTAYNQFAGLVNATSFAPPNYLKAIWPYSTTNIGYVTQTITNYGTNLDITITNVEIRSYVMIGGSFLNVGGNPSYHAPLRNNYTVFTRSDKRNRANVARLLGGVTPGPGNAEFDADSYPVVENMGFSSIRMRRTDGRLGSLLGVAVTLPRTAVPDRDYLISTNANAWIEGNFSQWSVGSVKPVFWNIPIIDNDLTTGNRQLDLQFLRAEGSLNLGGEYIPLGGALGRARAVLTIAEDDFPAGEFNFLYANFITNENATYATITVIRTNGSVGPVTVDYLTEHSTIPVAATEGMAGDYEPASGRLSFASGQTTNSFVVRIYDDTMVEYDETVALVLTNASGGAKLPGGLATSTARAILTIVDNDYPSGRLNFSSEVFTNSERDELAKITVTRTGGNYKQISVQFRTWDGTAASPADYIPTNGLLQWDSGDSLPKSFMVRLIPDGEVRGPKTVNLALTNAMVGFDPDPVLLGARAKATLVIADADAYGSLSFSQPYYQMEENAGTANIIVVRSGGSAGTVTINYTARAATAIPGVDFTPVNGTLTLLPGQISSSFQVPLLDDQVSDGNKTVWLELTDPVNASPGALTKVLLTIVDNESYNEPAGSLDTFFKADTAANGPVNALALQLGTNGVPDGRLLVAGDFTEINRNLRNRLARLLTNGTLDVDFDAGQGPNDIVRAVAVQPDSKVLIGGFFTQVASTNRNGIARLYADGTVDTGFNPGSGADNPVYALEVLPDGRILVAGAFSGINNIKRPGIARLNPDGAVDTSFLVGTGPNGPVYALALQSDGKIILGGDFTQVNAVDCGHLARLLPDGTLDTTFAIGAGVDAAVWTLLVQPDGGIVVAGDFTSVSGLPRSRLARIKPNGQVDPDFLNGLEGANGVIFALKQQVDGKLVVAGDFTRFNGVTRNRITRLNADGTTDFSINFGLGANGFIGALVIQPDRKIVLGGGFTAYDGQPRDRIARIHGGASAGNGLLEFSQPLFYVEETGTNALVTVLRRGGTESTVGATVRAFNGTATDGTDFVAITNVITFPPGEILQNVLVPVKVVGVPHEDRFFYVELGDFTGGAVNGPQPRAMVFIRNTKSLVSFAASILSVAENVASSNAVILVTRSLATNMAVWVQFATLTNGTATPGTDYLATNGWLAFQPGETNQIFRVRILDDKMIEGNESFGLELTTTDTNVSIGPFGHATMTIVDDDFGPGDLTFSSPQFTVREDAGFVEVTILRTNGTSGVIALNYATADGTAIQGSDYSPMNGRLTFADGQTSQSLSIRILDDTQVEGDETFTLTISNPTGGAKISGSAVATINIVDNEFGPGSLYAQFDAGPGMEANGLVRALALQSDGKFVVGGTFTNFNNRPHYYLARLHPDGSLDTNYNAQANALVTAIVPTAGNKMLIAGNFSQVNGTNRNRVALVRDDGASDGGFTASNALDSAVYCLAALPDGKLLLGGSFKQPVYGIVRLLASGAMDVGFVSGVGADGAVYALDRLDNGKIILGGGFAHVTGSPRGGVACLNEDGLLDEFYLPGAVSGGAASVYALAKTPDGKVVIGGDFTAVGGVACPRLARLNADGSLDSGFAPILIDGTVFAVAIQPDNKVLIGGAFTNVNGSARARIARLQADGSLDLQFDPGRGADNTVYALKLLADGKVLLGGSFNTLNGAPRHGVAVLRGDILAPKLLSQGYAPGSFLLRVQGEPGMRYALEASPDLRAWSALQTNTANSATLDLTDPGAVMTQRFYRVRLVP